MKTFLGILKIAAYALVIWPVVGLLEALLFFIPTAALFGFVAWILGADSPRDVALVAGAIAGAVAWLWVYAKNWVNLVTRIQSAVLQAQIDRALGEDSSP